VRFVGIGIGEFAGRVAAIEQLAGAWLIAAM
jgi:hypothetical protein